MLSEISQSEEDNGLHVESKELNEQTKRKQTHRYRESWGLPVGRGHWVRGEGVEK